MIRAGILGYGYMGHVHTQKIAPITGIDVFYVHDIDPAKQAEAEKAGYVFSKTAPGSWPSRTWTWSSSPRPTSSIATTRSRRSGPAST